jgi:hypothetical protein
LDGVTKTEQERILKKANWIVPLRGIAIASAVIALTCLVALVVVATVTKADTLSTVALTLAIIAFVVQIIVFIVQSGTAAQQMVQSQELFGTTQGLLGKIGEQTAGTQAAVHTINDRLLEVALDKALLQARITGSGTGAINRVDAGSVAADALSYLPQTTATSDTPYVGPRDEPRWPPPLPADEASSRLRALVELSSDEEAIERVLDVVDNDAFAGAIAKTMAEDERTSLEKGGYGPGLRLASVASEALLERGLIERLARPYEDIFQLTPQGRVLGSLLIGQGESPQGVAARIEELRRSIGEFERDSNDDTG